MSVLQSLREAIADAGLPGLIVSNMENVRWATGFTGSFGLLVVTPTEARFLTDSRYTIQAAEQVQGMPTTSFAAPVLSEEFLAKNLAEMGIREIAFESPAVTYATFEKWRKACDGIELIPGTDLIAPLRMVKSADEITKVRAACRLADACFDHFRRLIRPGISEYDLGLEIEFFFRRHGAGLAFEPIVVSGLNSARPHGRPSEKLLENGDFVTFDFGAKLDGLCSDLTRTVVIGSATDRHREIYDTCLRAQLASLDMMKPGIEAKAVDAKAREVMGDYARYFGHGLGHGLGTVVHDGGRLAASSTDILRPGQVWTVEPGIYIEGFGGVRIEDDVVMTESGIEILTHSPKELLCFPE